MDQVKASGKLKSHPVCLTSGEGMTFEMEKYFAAVQPDLALKAKRILEVNVEHPAFAALESARITDPDRAKKYAEILLNQAMLIAGLPLENPLRLYGSGLLPVEVIHKIPKGRRLSDRRRLFISCSAVAHGYSGSWYRRHRGGRHHLGDGHGHRPGGGGEILTPCDGFFPETKAG